MTTCHRAQRGNAVVEFALSISLLSVLFTGTYQYGYTMHVYNTLETSVANAARSAMRTTLRTDSKAAFRTAIRNLVVYGNTAGTGNPVVPDLAPAHVVVTWAPDSTANPPIPPETVTVAITGFRINGMFGGVNLVGKPRVTMPYAGNFMFPPGGGGGGGK